jgi:triacylglycerol lipase
MSPSPTDIFSAVGDDCYSVAIALTLARICNAVYLPSSQWQDDDTVKSLLARDLIEGEKDTHCLIADVDGTDITILAFRGTGPFSTANWLADFEAALQPTDSAIQTHKGFEQNYHSLEPQILKTLSTNRKLWVTGHSLGGALATLATVELPKSGFGVRATYTFGGPRVGNEAFAATLPSRFYRFVYGKDIVPHLPPQDVYQHGGIKVSLSDDGTLDRAAEAGDDGDADAPEAAALVKPTASLAADDDSSALGQLEAAMNMLNPQRRIEILLDNPVVGNFIRALSGDREAIIAEKTATLAADLFVPALRDHFPGKYIDALELALSNADAQG